MKQLIIAGGAAYGLNFAAATGTLGKGSLALLSKVTLLNNVDTVSSTKEVAIAIGNADNKLTVPCVINAKGITVTKSTYVAATYAATDITAMSVGTVTEGKPYSIMIALAGQPTGARCSYTATVASREGDTLGDIAAKLVKEINLKLADKGIVASFATDTLSITASQVGKSTVYDFTVQCADSLVGTVTKKTVGAKAINDADYITSLYEQCIGGNGIFDPEGNETNYVRPTISGTYTVFNLSFTNPRAGKQTSYQNVIQNVMIAIPTGSAQIANFEGILGKLADGTIKFT